MDIGIVLAAQQALSIQAGAVIALLVALASALARAQVRSDERARRAAAENEALRDEVWRLKEAAAARDRTEAASQAKSRFLATMSHEIRTPLNGILGMADLLRRAGLSAENASYVEAIHSSGAALIALIDQILDLSRIEAGRLDLAVEPVDLPRLVEGVVELLASRAQSKGLEIASSISAATPRFVRGMADLLSPAAADRTRAAVGQSLGEMDAADRAAAVEIGERAGELEHPVIAARGKPEPLGGVAHQAQARIVGVGDRFDEARRRGGVAGHGLVAEFGVAREARS